MKRKYQNTCTSKIPDFISVNKYVHRKVSQEKSVKMLTLAAPGSGTVLVSSVVSSVLFRLWTANVYCFYRKVKPRRLLIWGKNNEEFELVSGTDNEKVPWAVEKHRRHVRL